MHDIRSIRDDGPAFAAAMRRRGIEEALFAALPSQDVERRQAQTALQEQQARRNALSRQVGEGRRRGENTAAHEAEAGELGRAMGALEQQVAALDQDIHTTLASLPNVLDADVPDGADETANKVIKTWGLRPDFDFAAKQHFELGEALGMMDFATAGKLAGSRFVLLRGPLARLERALGQFMLDHAVSNGYEETAVPLLVNDAAMFGTNQLPKFAEDSFRTTDGRWLIATSEIPLTNSVAGEILPEARLPIRLTALSECFRSEAGSAGRDTRGMLRQHQFRKVEMVAIAHPDHSDAEHERMTACAEQLLELLQLPYRRMLLCAGDTGFGSAKTYDLEVWLPGQGMYREISSCSNMRAFQARRMNARVRAADGRGIAHVHTLNGSGVAVGRALIAVMENNQQPDGSILIPEVLGRYMNDIIRIA